MVVGWNILWWDRISRIGLQEGILQMGFGDGISSDGVADGVSPDGMDVGINILMGVGMEYPG